MMGGRSHIPTCAPYLIGVIGGKVAFVGAALAIFNHAADYICSPDV